MVILTCWIIPYIVLSAVLIRVSIVRSERQVTNTLASSMESAGLIVMENILNGVEDSRQASYDGVIKKSYETYLKDGNESAMHRTVTDYLNKTYKFSKTISNTILLYWDDMQMEYYTYSNVAGATYASIEEFKNDTAEAVRLTARDLDTKTRLICLSGHMYVVRNIVLSNYEPFATFVMELNMDRLFAPVESIIWKEDGIAVLDEDVVYEWIEDEPGEERQDGAGDAGEDEAEEGSEGAGGAGEDEAEEGSEGAGGAGEDEAEGAGGGEGETGEGAGGTGKDNAGKDGTGARAAQLAAALKLARENGEAPKDQRMVFTYNPKDNTACLDMKVNGQRYAFSIGLDRSAMLGDRTAFLSVYLLVFITLIPLLIATFYFFYSNINKPIGTLVEGAEKIRSGQYGYQVEPFRKNEEISQLVDNFNHMSKSLEESFRRIYVEEIAGRDATLKALQSQINPHFLNNTLEIINWKARMNGNEDVSEMISALSVMMNAALNRNNEMFVTLEEELTYVDAYLYIIKERFGSRFSFTKEIDTQLLDCSVPRLIIQPIVENAVEHGGDSAGNRVGKLRIFGDRTQLHIVVENNGTLTEKDKEKIAHLLSDAEQLQGGGQHIDSSSIGIRNVHRRLRMIYGKDSGLTITDPGDGRTVSEIIITRE